MALKTQPRKQHSQVVKSLHELGSLTSPPTPASADHVPTADVKDVELKALDANSAHVVVTLRAEDAAAIPAAAPTETPATHLASETKEIDMTQATSPAATAAADLAHGMNSNETAPAQAPAVTPVAAGPVINAAERFGFNPDFSFLDNPVALNKRLHDLSNASNATNDRVDTLEDRMRRIESGGVGFGRTVISEDTSVEAIAYKVGTAALVGAAAYTGVKLASWLLDSGTPAGE